MAIYRVNMSFQYDSAFPRDAMTINPHFFGDNPQALAEALAVNLRAMSALTPTFPFRIRVYDAEKAPPSYPLHEIINATGFASWTIGPRETAICLSYYSTWNRPRYRGRLYLPAQWVQGTLGPRPTATQRTNALNFRNVLTTGLPPSHNWVVYSPTNQDAYGVSDCWVDDEWDTIRSRGLRGTVRETAEVP